MSRALFIVLTILLACSIYTISYTLLRKHCFRSHEMKFVFKQTFSVSRNNNAENVPQQIAKKNFDGRGCTLVSKNEEFDRFMSKSIVFIFEHSVERGSQGVILNKVPIFYFVLN